MRPKQCYLIHNTSIFKSNKEQDQNGRKFPNFTQNGKILIPVDGNKLFTYTKIFRTTTIKTMQKYMSTALLINQNSYKRCKWSIKRKEKNEQHNKDQKKQTEYIIVKWQT